MILRTLALIVALTGTAGAQTLDCFQMGQNVPAATGLAGAGTAAAAANEKPFAVIRQSALWKRNPIPVCWENMEPEFARDREVVRQAIAETWEKHSRVRFSGWQQCAQQNAGIRIAVVDLGPVTAAFGAELDGRPMGMMLNFTFKNFASRDCRGSRRERCIASIAVHEFGHALGFAHEQNRPDSPGECMRKAQGPSGDVMLTPWDRDSVMNYCNPRFSGQLSASDIRGIQCAYGMP